jgi:hypothetical protein
VIGSRELSRDSVSAEVTVGEQGATTLLWDQVRRPMTAAGIRDLSQAAAREPEHDSIGSEHILLGLLREQSNAPTEGRRGPNLGTSRSLVYRLTMYR